MRIDLSKFGRRHDFNLLTKAHGTIQCGTLKPKLHSAVAEILSNPDSDALVSSRQILGLVGQKEVHPRGNADSQVVALSDADIQQITDDEIEKFARDFVALNDWLLHCYDDESRQISTDENGEEVVPHTPSIEDFPKGEEERSSQYLIRVLRRYLEDRGRRLKNMLAPLSGPLLASNALTEQYKKLIEPLSTRLGKGIFSDSALESMRRNLSMSDQLQDTIKAFKKSTIDHELKRSSVEPNLLQARPLSIPDNPLIETNRRLGAVLDQMQEMRPLVAQSAELIGNMNDTALKMQVSFMTNARSTQRYAVIAIVIAALGLVASSIFSWLSYSDGKQHYERIDTQTKLFEAKFLELISIQDKDRAVFVDGMNAARQSTDAPKRSDGEAE